MEKVKLSELLKDDIVLVEGNALINTVSDILEDLEFFKTKEIYTTKEYKASFNAEDIIDNAIENEYNNGMYEDWDDYIKADVTKEDIDDLQNILDRILSRNPSANIAYASDKLIEIDM
jgi:sulfatase maturation enzyme AslB (radical SAM superfamily)